MTRSRGSRGFFRCDVQPYRCNVDFTEGDSEECCDKTPLLETSGIRNDAM
jgi:hypothetical protein